MSCRRCAISRRTAARSLSRSTNRAPISGRCSTTPCCLSKGVERLTRVQRTRFFPSSPKWAKSVLRISSACSSSHTFPLIDLTSFLRSVPPISSSTLFPSITIRSRRKRHQKPASITSSQLGRRRKDSSMRTRPHPTQGTPPVNTSLPSYGKHRSLALFRSFWPGASSALAPLRSGDAVRRTQY